MTDLNVICSEFKNVSEFGDEEGEAVLSLLMQHVESQRANILTKKKEFEETEAKLQTEIDKFRQVGRGLCCCT